MNRKRNRRILYYCYKSKNIRTILGGASIWRWAIRDKHLNFREWFYDNYNFARDDDIGIGYFRNDGYRTIHTISYKQDKHHNFTVVASRICKKLSQFK